MGSGEHKSIHELATPMIWLIVSSGVRGVSAGVKGGMVTGEAFLVLVMSSSEVVEW